MCVVASMDYHIRQHGTHLSLKVTPHRMSVLRAPFGFTEAAVRFVPLVNRKQQALLSTVEWDQRVLHRIIDREGIYSSSLVYTRLPQGPRVGG